MNETLTIVLADDHPYFRKGFKEALECFPRFNVVGEADNGKELLDLCKTLQPALVFTDLKMPEMDGLTAIKQLRKEKNAPHIIILTSLENDADRYETLIAGAKGFLPKAVRLAELNAAVDVVVNSPYYYCCFDSAILNNLLKQHVYPDLPQQFLQFTTRELEIWEMLKQEKTSVEIGQELFITPEAVKFHRNNLLQKTGSRNSIGLILYGIKHKIIKVKE